MATTEVSLCAADLNLCFTHGDTFAWTITLKDSAGVAITIPAGYAYQLTTNTELDPTDETNQVFVLDGVVLTQSGATLGQVQFRIEASHWTSFDAAVTSLPNTIFFDLEETDTSGFVRTLAKGEFEVRQDINKP